MRKITFGMLAIAAGFLIQGATVGSAQAAPMGSSVAAAAKAEGSGVTQVRHGRHWRGGGWRGGPRHWRGGWRGPRVGFYAGPRWGGGGCGWLRQRAAVTGSPYWWRRFNACRMGW